MTEVAAPGLTVRVESFEGPLDLLLHLCRTSEVDLARLPIRTVTDQYLAHLESVRFQDLETAGSFMVMAATLIYLKSKLLLPPTGEPGEDEMDPEGELLRQELAARLAEYARVKTLGGWLAAREAEQALLFGRTTAELPPPEEIPLQDLSVHLLTRAINRLIEEQKRERPREVEPNPISSSARSVTTHSARTRSPPATDEKRSDHVERRRVMISSMRSSTEMGLGSTSRGRSRF